MTARLKTISEHIPAAEVFADVGCDHGYCAKYMLENGLCKRAYITDISRRSLKKAENLLVGYIAAGKCVSLCCDGLDLVPEPCGSVLIAGMGGEEIIHILKKQPLPENFVLQPMKNAEKVRAFLLEQGAKITIDYTFRDEKYYDLIVGKREGGDHYTEYELLFGRDNLTHPSPVFLQKLQDERKKLRFLTKTFMRKESRAEIYRRLSELEGVIDAIEGDLRFRK